MISIIIPVYNQGKKLINTLISLEAQTYRDFEVVIVNDGSTDGVETLISNFLRKINPSNSYLFINQVNQGPPAARNRGFAEARGNYLFFCDADAVLVPKALETLLNALEANPSASYVYSSFLWGRKMFKLDVFDAEKLRRMPYIHTMSLIRRIDYPTTGWDKNIKKLQDWDLWLTMLERDKIGLFIPEVLFTVSPGGTISSWVPSFAYKLFPFLNSVKKYKKAVQIIKKKHGLV